jgi:hypothetical protein
MMRMKYTKRFYLRMTAIMLALFMVVTGPVRAFAAEEGYDQADFEEEIDIDAGYEDEFDDGDDYEPTQEELERLLGLSQEETVSEDDIDIDVDGSDEVNDDNFLPEDIQEDSNNDIFEEEIGNDEEANVKKALKLFRNSGSIPNYQVGDANIPTDKYAVTRYANYVKVENKYTNKNDQTNYLYAALVYADPEKNKGICMLGTKIAPGKSVKLLEVYSSSSTKDRLNEEADYLLWIGYTDTYTEEGSETPEYLGWKILGYIPQYDDDWNEIIVDGEPVYSKAEMDEVSIPASSIAKPETDSTWSDGYLGIKMKAQIQKNLSSVKISWATDTKKYPDQKNYKKYALYHLEEDSSTETGYKETLIKELKTKSVTVKNVNTEEDSLLYLLKCMDADGKVIAQYVTAAAPYMLQMQSGEETGEFDFTMTQRTDLAQIYFLELASKNKENDDVKVTTGFQEAWRTIYDSESVFGIGKYYVSKNVNSDAIMLTYSLDQPQVILGNTYYGRVRTVTYVNNLVVTSAPSNVLSCKAGPQKCHIITNAGVYYDTKDAKAGNKYNLERANEHINAYFGGYEIPASSQMYVHGTNTSVCAKDGLIYFKVKKDKIDSIKSFDLLKCNYENGAYKKLKSYTIGNTALMECTLSEGYLEDYKVYAMFYNKFTPEKDAYYAVRAISTTKKTPGGKGDGELIVPDMDVVQNLVTADADSDKIMLMWHADDCVKQYWLYRGETSINGMQRKSAGENGDVRIAKIGIDKVKKFTTPLTEENDQKVIKYILYTDKKNIKINTPYYYYVRPIYNTKAAASDNEKYIDKCSDEVMGKASAMYAQVKNFKVSSEATKKIKISFTQKKNITQYRIFRLEVDSAKTKLSDDMKPKIEALYKEAEEAGKTTYDEIESYIAQLPAERWIEFIQTYGAGAFKWEYLETIATTGKSTATKTWTDTSVRVGRYYFYLIQPATLATADTEASSSINFTYSSIVHNKPLPVDNARISYEDSGIRLNYSYNSRETSTKYLDIELSIDGGSYKKVGTTTYTHHNPRRGVVHNYCLRVKYDDGIDEATSEIVKLTYSLPSSIEISKASGSGEFSNNNEVFTLKLGEEATLSYKARLDDGSSPTNANVSRSETPSDSEVLANITSGNNSFSFKANKVGTVTYYLTCEGINRKITINVIK